MEVQELADRLEDPDVPAVDQPVSRDLLVAGVVAGSALMAVGAVGVAVVGWIGAAVVAAAAAAVTAGDQAAWLCEDLAAAAEVRPGSPASTSERRRTDGGQTGGAGSSAWWLSVNGRHMPSSEETRRPRGAPRPAAGAYS